MGPFLLRNVIPKRLTFILSVFSRDSSFSPLEQGPQTLMHTFVTGSQSPETANQALAMTMMGGFQWLLV